MHQDEAIFSRLMSVVEDRTLKRPPHSYTAELIDGGVEVIGAKISEEATEVIEAARIVDHDDRRAIIHEAADLVYHLFVMLAYCNVKLADLEAELERRFGTSGLEEKASRPAAKGQ